MTDEIPTSQGGICAPISPHYDLFRLAEPEPDQQALAAASVALAVWLRAPGGQELVDRTRMLNAEADVETLAKALADHAVTTYLADVARRPIERSLPKVSAPHGKINFVVPGYEYQASSRLAIARSKARSRVQKALGPYRRLKAAQARLSDARAVWRGEKDALTDAEQEALSDY